MPADEEDLAVSQQMQGTEEQSLESNEENINVLIKIAIQLHISKMKHYKNKKMSNKKNRLKMKMKLMIQKLAF